MHHVFFADVRTPFTQVLGLECYSCTHLHTCTESVLGSCRNERSSAADYPGSAIRPRFSNWAEGPRNKSTTTLRGFTAAELGARRSVSPPFSLRWPLPDSNRDVVSNEGF